jgi:hypothetical protein
MSGNRTHNSRQRLDNNVEPFVPIRLCNAGNRKQSRPSSNAKMLSYFMRRKKGMKPIRIGSWPNLRDPGISNACREEELSCELADCDHQVRFAQCRKNQRPDPVVHYFKSVAPHEILRSVTMLQMSGGDCRIHMSAMKKQSRIVGNQSSSTALDTADIVRDRDLTATTEEKQDASSPRSNYVPHSQDLIVTCVSYSTGLPLST